MAAVWELTKPELKGRYAVTVYQEGWRLGGKGASGRGPNGRIEEHGLHIWLGFYDNAFRMMRECHAELDAHVDGNPYGDWRDAFTPENDIALYSAAEDGGFERWDVHMPARPGLPGDPLPPDAVFSLPYYMAKAFDLFRTLLLDTAVDGQGVGPRRGEDGRIDPIVALAYLTKLGAFASVAALAEGLGLLSTILSSSSTKLTAPVLDAAERICDRLRLWLENKWIADNRHRFMWEVADLTLATMVGLIRHGVMADPKGLDAIDHLECREWLRMNGASVRSLQSPFLRGLYDLSMGYEDGDLNKPRLSAGQGLRGTLRTFFGYRGAFMWRMRAGMGDVVFAPLYEALVRRGVTFEFFHRLTNVGLPPEWPSQPDPWTASDEPEPDPPRPPAPSHVQSLAFDVQARTLSGGPYKPLKIVPDEPLWPAGAGRPCWPSAPDLTQLVDGADLADWNFESHWDRGRAGEITLKVGEDFDFVVLAVGLGAVPHVCPEILARDRRWLRMTQEVKTVASQAFQVWLTEDLESLGWKGPAYITGAFAKPFDTWCDMAHVVPEEAWAKDRRPKTSVYFCAVLPDPKVPPRNADAGYPVRRAQEVRRNAEDFLQGPIREVWPLAFELRGDFRWELLAEDSAAPGQSSPTGIARFGTQYWRANVNPSERYVIHTPGSFRFRISPLDMTYDNLTIAGDWTDNGFHSGCVEGAVMSGLLAAHALSGAPKLEDITAYDHP